MENRHIALAVSGINAIVTVTIIAIGNISCTKYGLVAISTAGIIIANGRKCV